jgi:guanylate kinase
MPKGPLIIVSGPAGAGKSTLIRRVLAQSGLPLRLSVSATTRPRRQREREGVDYYFWTRERFLEELEAGAFLEHAEVVGNLYGTLRREVDRYREQGTGVILDVDVQGARKMRALCPDHLSVFVMAPSLEEYERRLRARGTEDEASIARRLANARRELAEVDQYQHVVVNDDLDRAVAELSGLIARAFEGRHGGGEPGPGGRL